jgi:TonB family protein
MHAALFYRARNRGLIWVAFVCAIAVHVTAVVFAENRSKPVSSTWGSEPDEAVIGTIDSQSPQRDEVSPPEQTLPPPDDDAFPQEDSTPRPVHPHKRTPVTSTRSTNIATGRSMNAGSLKALALYAPLPAYPYEARRGGITGSGIARLTVNPEVGSVIDAQMAQSTGSVVLDNATVETLRRWHFKPGGASKIDVPITYTLTGASY